MKLVFAGTPEVAVPALDALIASGRHEVAAVVTRPDAPAGRGRHLVASPVAQRAEEAGIEVLKPHRPRDEDFLARLREIAPDCCPVVAYGALLPRVALDVPVHGWVNLHFSLLPAWRGAAPVQHSIMSGDEITGASTFLIEEGLDSGPVYGTVTEEIRPTDIADEQCVAGQDSVRYGIALAAVEHQQRDPFRRVARRLQNLDADIAEIQDIAIFHRQEIEFGFGAGASGAKASGAEAKEVAVVADEDAVVSGMDVVEAEASWIVGSSMRRRSGRSPLT